MLPRKRWFYITSGIQLSETISTFNAELQIPDSEDYDRIVLTQVLIPLSYYVIGAGDNVFELNENGVAITITIPPGNYDTTNFPAIIGPLLTASSLNGITYTVSYPNPATSPQTGKFTFTAENTTIPIYFAFPEDEDLAIRFGFDRGQTEYFTQAGPNEVLISPNVVDFTAENAIFIHSNLVQDDYSDILQEVYQANTIPGTNITYLCPDPLAYSKKLSSSKLRLASFALTDEFNFPIFLNGLDVVLTIMLYKEPNVFQLISNYLRYVMTRDMGSLGILPTVPERPKPPEFFGPDNSQNISQKIGLELNP